MCFYLSILYIYVVTKNREKQETVVIPAGIAEHPPPVLFSPLNLLTGTTAAPSPAHRPLRAHAFLQKA